MNCVSWFLSFFYETTATYAKLEGDGDGDDGDKMPGRAVVPAGESETDAEPQSPAASLSPAQSWRHVSSDGLRPIDEDDDVSLSVRAAAVVEANNLSGSQRLLRPRSSLGLLQKGTANVGGQAGVEIVKSNSNSTTSSLASASLCTADTVEAADQQELAAAAGTVKAGIVAAEQLADGQQSNAPLTPTRTRLPNVSEVSPLAWRTKSLSNFSTFHSSANGGGDDAGDLFSVLMSSASSSGQSSVLGNSTASSKDLVASQGELAAGSAAPHPAGRKTKEEEDSAVVLHGGVECDAGGDRADGIVTTAQDGSRWWSAAGVSINEHQMFKPVANLEAHIELLSSRSSKNAFGRGDGFDDEFRFLELRQFQRLRMLQFNAARHLRNAFKNRYPDVLPTDNARVRLDCPCKSDQNKPSDESDRLEDIQGRVSTGQHVVSPRNGDGESVTSRSATVPSNAGSALVAASAANADARPFSSNDNCCCSMDYINASWIAGQLPGSQRRYISMQGPLRHTFGDVWRLVWERGTRVIVMLTKEIERGFVKCDRYLPPTASQTFVKHGERFSVRLVSQRRLDAEVTERRVQLRHEPSGEIRDLVHFQYTGWPDHGIPLSSAPFLNLVRSVMTAELELTGQSRPLARAPLCVHCSAGIGRSGTFIAVHSTLERWIEEGQTAPNGRSVSLLHFIDSIRHARISMVQTPNQLRFAYKALAELSNSFDSFFS